MQPFQLETSGDVRNLAILPFARVIWGDLSPFAQGYVEALIQCADAERRAARPFGQYLRLGFSDLSPEALAMILRDCEAMAGRFPAMRFTANDGFAFWGSRKAGFRTGADAFHGATLNGPFPPLRVYLDDAGKVRLEPA